MHNRQDVQTIYLSGLCGMAKAFPFSEYQYEDKEPAGPDVAAK